MAEVVFKQFPEDSDQSKPLPEQNQPRPTTHQDDDDDKQKKKEEEELEPSDNIECQHVGNGSILQLERKWLLSIHMMIKKKKR